MNNGNSDTAPVTPHARVPQGRAAANEDELSRTKRELLQAEVRLAKARVTVVTAEIDVKVLTSKLKTLVS